MELPLSNVINISASQAPAGAGNYNTSNVAIITREAYTSEALDNDGYLICLSADDIGTAFGTTSVTFKMAVALFAQNPNILANSGYLVIIPYADTSAVVEVQHIAFSTVPASGNFKLKYGANTTGNIANGASAATVQTALQLLSGLGSATVAGDQTAGYDVTFTGVSGPAILLIAPDSGNSLQDSTPIDVHVTITVTTHGTVLSTETFDTAITRTKDLVQYFGVMTAEITTQVNELAAAAVIQALNKIAYFVSRTSADVAPGGMIDLLTTGGFNKSRGLFYGGATDLSALQYMAGYAGRGQSTNFTGSNTTQNMHLKELQTIQPDPSMTQTLLAACMLAGADTYISLDGVSAVFSSGANKFFDQVYNLGWYIGALQIAMFNVLRQTSTKIAQTENGVATLKGAARKVSEAGVTNQYLAPGTWTLPNTFGNQADFYQNISQAGYYIYSVPVSQQSQADRDARIAPLIQIAAKEAGATNSSNVLININA